MLNDDSYRGGKTPVETKNPSGPPVQVWLCVQARGRPPRIGDRSAQTLSEARRERKVLCPSIMTLRSSYCVQNCLRLDDEWYGLQRFRVLRSEYKLGTRIYQNRHLPPQEGTRARGTLSVPQFLWWLLMFHCFPEAFCSLILELMHQSSGAAERWVEKILGRLPVLGEKSGK